MPIRYKAQLNKGNANIGSERSVSANEDLLACDEKALAREISHQSHGLITEDVAALVLSHFAKAATEKMSEGFRIQFHVDGKAAMIIFPDIHVKGGNINLARARQLDPTVTELTAENAAALIDKAGGVTCRVRCTAMQPFTDLLEKVGYTLERTGTIETAYVEASDGSSSAESGDTATPAATGPVLTVTKTGAGSFTLTNQAGQPVESGATVPAGHTLTLRVSAAGSATPTATIGGQTVTLVEDEGRYVGTFLMPSTNATLTVKTGGSGDNEE